MRSRLRGLSKEHAEYVGLHLVMAGRLLDVDPERAYEHTQAAVRGAGRIDIVREAAGLAAYHTNRYAEALRELRTVRRLNGSSEHLPIMADAERGLGRPERALALAASEEAATLDATGRIELAIVASGARSDLGEHDAALAVLDKVSAEDAQGDLGLRVVQARAVALEAAGRAEEAAALLASVDSEALERAIGAQTPDEDITVFDVEEDAALAEQEYAADHPEEFADDEDSDEDSSRGGLDERGLGRGLGRGRRAEDEDSATRLTPATPRLRRTPRTPLTPPDRRIRPTRPTSRAGPTTPPRRTPSTSRATPSLTRSPTLRRPEPPTPRPRPR